MITDCLSGAPQRRLGPAPPLRTHFLHYKDRRLNIQGLFIFNPKLLPPGRSSAGDTAKGLLVIFRRMFIFFTAGLWRHLSF